jgi:hypothetical protein
VEAPVSAAPESDFWVVLADDVDRHLASLVETSPKDVASRFVILRPGRDRAFALLEELDAAAAVEAYGADVWSDPPFGGLVVRRVIIPTDGGQRSIFPEMNQ